MQAWTGLNVSFGPGPLRFYLSADLLTLSHICYLKQQTHEALTIRKIQTLSLRAGEAVRDSPDCACRGKAAVQGFR